MIAVPLMKGQDSRKGRGAVRVPRTVLVNGAPKGKYPSHLREVGSGNRVSRPSTRPCCLVVFANNRSKKHRTVQLATVLKGSKQPQRRRER